MSDPNVDSSDAAGSSSVEPEPKGVVFVGWTPGEDDVPRKHPPRLYHKKSRAGCQQCKARRVKCNEVHPVCGSCERHQVTCVWGRDRPATRPDGSPEFNTSKAYDIRPKVKPPPPGAPEIPESKDRRLTELSLLHHFQTITSYTLNRPNAKLHEWSILVPRLAFKHDSLLYSIYTTAALHLASREPHEPKHVENYQKYLGLTLRLHRDDVATLSKANADAAMITSSTLRICTFALLQERSLEPYIPPVEWLNMNFGTGHGLAVAAWKFIADDPKSLMREMMAGAPGLNSKNPQLRDANALFNENNRKGLGHLLRRTPYHEANELWTAGIQIAYESTVSYIGVVQKAIAEGEPEPSLFRRLLLFPTLVEKGFIDLVEERQPRALVVLAHYFAFLTRFKDFWWIGQAGPREVRAIRSVLGEEWQDLLAWPLKTIGEDPALLKPIRSIE